MISHNHRDHLDEPTILALGPAPTYVVPLGMASWFRKRGMRHVIELDWWETTEVTTSSGARVVVSFVPAQHWSQRGLTDENKSLWGGYVLDVGDRRFYFAGDTAYPAAFTEIGKRFPNLDYALLPIGAYAPRWFMRPQHMDPEEAAKAFHELGARALVPMHWGTFHLSDEPMGEPPRRLRAAMGERRESRSSSSRSARLGSSRRRPCRRRPPSTTKHRSPQPSLKAKRSQARPSV